jgi:hypothetical protein
LSNDTTINGSSEVTKERTDMIDDGDPLLRVQWTDPVVPCKGRVIGENSKDSFVYVGRANFDEATRFSQLVDGNRLLPRQARVHVVEESLDRVAREKMPAGRS